MKIGNMENGLLNCECEVSTLVNINNSLLALCSPTPGHVLSESVASKLCAHPLQASFCTDRLELFSFLCTTGIGVELAALYDAWATELEAVGNTKKADTVLMQGLERGAQPRNLLLTKHRYVCVVINYSSAK